jgi:hypothetical protein
MRIAAILVLPAYSQAQTSAEFGRAVDVTVDSVQIKVDSSEIHMEFSDIHVDLGEEALNVVKTRPAQQGGVLCCLD